MAGKRILTALLGVCLAAVTLLSGCGQTSAEPPKEKAYTSVVALSKSIADMWLLAGGSLSGVTEDALELDGISEDTVVVGTVKKPSTEAILALKPDLVLFSGELAAHEQLKAELDKLSVTVMPVTVDSFEDYDAVIRKFTEMTGREDLYQKNVTDVKQRIDRIIADKGEKFKGTAYLCLRASAANTKALKKDHFTCAILDSLGLSNIADDDSALNDLNIEEIALRNPDYIFVVFMGDDEEAAKAFSEEFENQAVFRELKAVKENRLIFLPKDLFHNKPNERWDEAYSYVCDILEKQ